MIRIIGLSDLEYSLLNEEYSHLVGLHDDNSNTVEFNDCDFDLNFYRDHVSISFPSYDNIISIMRCDFWRIEIE